MDSTGSGISEKNRQEKASGRANEHLGATQVSVQGAPNSLRVPLKKIDFYEGW